MRSASALNEIAPAGDAAVDLGQHDVHGEIGRAEAARLGGPGCRASAPDSIDLQHGRVGADR